MNKLKAKAWNEEQKSKPQTEDLIKNHWAEKIVFVHNEGKHSQGIAILFSNSRLN